MVLFIDYPKCSTCQKAKKWLNEHNIEYKERNITKQIPTAEELKKWMKESEKEIKKFFNTRGVKYKELNLKDGLKEMDFDEKIKILSSDGMLIKRPLLVTEEKIYIGFKEKEWENLIKNKREIIRKFNICYIKSLLFN